jgi:transcriptional regulator with XRE-family HTH domain
MWHMVTLTIRHIQGAAMKLQQYMTDKGIKDKAAAAELGIDRPYVSTIRRGLREPSLRLACHIEKWSGGLVTPRELLTAD